MNQLRMKCGKSPKSDLDKYISCLKGKIWQVPYKSSVDLAKNVCELTYVGTLLSSIELFGGSKYPLIFKDDLSKFCTVYFLKKQTRYHCLVH